MTHRLTVDTINQQHYYIVEEEDELNVDDIGGGCMLFEVEGKWRLHVEKHNLAWWKVEVIEDGS